MKTLMQNRLGKVVEIDANTMRIIGESLMYFECEDGIWRHFSDIGTRELKKKS
jgi:hypothetical protein